MKSVLCLKASSPLPGLPYFRMALGSLICLYILKLIFVSLRVYSAQITTGCFSVTKLAADYYAPSDVRAGHYGLKLLKQVECH